MEVPRLGLDYEYMIKYYKYVPIYSLEQLKLSVNN